MLAAAFLTALVSTPASLNGQIRLDAGQANKLIVEKPEAVYPPLAKQMRLQGTVKADVTVSESGSVSSTKVVSGHPLLVTSALDAVKKYRYTPYLIDGKAAPFITTVEVTFSVGIPKKQYDDTCGPPVQGGTPTLYTADGTYLRMAWNPASGAWTLYFPDGRVVQGSGAQLSGHYYASGFGGSATDLFDRNGNRIRIQETTATDGTLTTTLTDDLNRVITVQHPPSGDDTIQQLGYPAQNPASPPTQPLTWTISWTNNTLSSDHTYPCGQQPACPGSNLGTQVVAGITLPNSQSYQFCYDGATTQSAGCSNLNPAQWGLLSLMKLPTGASVRYLFPTTPALSTNTTVNFPVSSKTLTWVDEDDSSQPQRVETSTYSFGPTQSTFTHPDGEVVTHFFYPIGDPGLPNTGLVYKTMNQVSGDVLEQKWQTNAPYGSSSVLPGNPYVQTELRSAGTPNSPAIAAGRVFSYDRNGNQTQLQEYDWVPYSAVVHDSSGAVTSFNGGGSIRTTSSQYINGAAGAVNGDGNSHYPLNGSSAADGFGYWNALSSSNNPQLIHLIYQTTVSGSSAAAQVAYDGNAFGQYSQITHGNPTMEQHWDSGANQYRQVSHSYDSFGNITSTQNARNYVTQYSYDSSKVGSCSTGVSTPSNLYVSQIVQAYGTSDARTFQFTHDCMSGATASDADVDHSLTRTYTYDNFSRLATVQEGSVRKTSATYNDLAREIDSYSDLNASGDQSLVQKSYYDQLGRVRLTRDSAGNLIQSHYLTPPGSGYNYELSSNPYVTQGEATMGWTLTQRDTVGRARSVQHFSGSSLPAPWGNNSTNSGTASVTYVPGNNVYCTTSTDEAGVSSTSCTDGLGRLKQVTETGLGATTFYGYDALDDLTCVTQGGTLTSGVCQNGVIRNFTYSSLKQLLSATNPENGLLTYTYDPNGNPLTRSDARGTTTSGYNGLDQITSKTYSDGTTPPVSYAYNKGWLTQVTSSASTYNYTNWDGIGRVTGANQITAGQTYPFIVQHKPSVGIAAIQYPNSNRVIATSYDSFGRPSSVSAQIGTNSATNYVGDISHPIGYAPHGGITSMALGMASSLPNGIPVTTQYNSRLQPNQIQAGAGVLSLGYCYRSVDCATTLSTQAQNNGNVLQQTITRSGAGAWTDNYTYDAANRLAQASESGAGSWSESNCYDTLGNRWVVAPRSGLPTSLETPHGTSCSGPGQYNRNNQITGWSYERGNVTQVFAMSRSFAYDAESRMTSATVNSQTSTYSYDGDGRRVQKAAPGGTTVYVYDPFGNLAQEYGPGGGLGGTEYVVSDALGSIRLVLDGSGAAVRCYDYLPFGEEIGNGTAGRTAGCFGSGSYPAATADIVSEKFTGKERDGETGLDWFIARYYSSAQGRFTSPDEPLIGQDPSNPQSWNLYSYGLNNLLLYTDPTGQNPCINGLNPETGNICAEGTAQSTRLSYFDELLLRSLTTTVQVAQRAQELVAPVVSAIDSFRQNPNCAASLAVGGAAAGAGIGAYVGGGVGGATGFTLGSVVPIAGNAAGLAGGGALGVAGGALAGGSIGGALGGLAGGVFCSSGTGGSGAAGGGASGSSANNQESKTADQIISQSKKASIRDVFPGQYLNSTLTQIRESAAAGDKAARTALKLLSNNRFNK